MSGLRPHVFAGIGIVCGLAWALPASAQQAQVSLEVSTRQVSVGQQFVLEARVDVEEGDLENFELPDLGDFQILGQRESRPYSFSFSFGSGTTSRSSVVHTYSLRALAPGRFTLGPVSATVDGKVFRSRPITLDVTDAAPGAPGSTAQAVPGAQTAPGAAQAAPTGSEPDIDPSRVDPKVFLHAVVDTPVARVGQQVTVSFYIYTRGGLSSAPTTTQEPTTEGFWVHNLLPPSRQLSATVQYVQGKQYRVYLWQRFAAFPLTPGTHRIGPMTVELGQRGSLFDMLSGTRKPLARSTPPLEIEVTPLPDGVDPDAPWHVGSLELAWTATPAQVAVGDAVTLRATLKGTGNLRAVRLPDPAIAGFEVLAPTVRDEVTETAGIVGGERTFEWLALARQPGIRRVPSPVVQQIDPDTGAVTQVRGAELELTVEGRAAAAAADTTPVSDASGDDPTPEDGQDALVLGSPRTRARLAPPAPPLTERAWFWPSLCVLPLLAGASFAGGWLRRARARRLDARGDLQLEQAAETALSEARRAAADPAAGLRLVRKALLLGVERAVGESAEASTYDQLERMLREVPQGSTELARQVAGLLRDIEAARFMPGGSDAAARDAVARAEPLLRDLRRLSPTEAKR